MGLLRLLLALSVVMAHSYPSFGHGLVGGRSAVQCFFVISGFYITLILNQQYKSTRDFYLNRALRLYPAYLVVLLLSFLYCVFISGLPSFPITVPGALMMIFANVTMLFQDLFFFTGIDPATGHIQLVKQFQDQEIRTIWFFMFPQAWSISIELVFYAIAPFIVRSPKALLGMLMTSIAVRLYTYGYVSARDPWTYRFVLSEMAMFALGGLAYHASVRWKAAYGHMAVKLLGSFVMLYFVWRFGIIDAFWKRHLPTNELGFVTDLATEMASMTIVLITAICLPCLMNLTKRIKWDRYIGDLSYPIYIGHLFIMRLFPLTGQFYRDLSERQQGWLAIICSVIFAIGLNYFVDRRIEKYRDSVRAHAASDKAAPLSIRDILKAIATGLLTDMRSRVMAIRARLAPARG